MINIFYITSQQVSLKSKLEILAAKKYYCGFTGTIKTANDNYQFFSIYRKASFFNKVKTWVPFCYGFKLRLKCARALDAAHKEADAALEASKKAKKQRASLSLNLEKNNNNYSKIFAKEENAFTFSPNAENENAVSRRYCV